jgi:hypothetical protein
MAAQSAFAACRGLNNAVDYYRGDAIDLVGIARMCGREFLWSLRLGAE